MLAKRNTAKNKQANLSRDLQRLKRQDLLELLVAQLREGERLQATITENEAQIAELTDLSERLKGKLDDKDVQIEHLKEKLNDKDAQIERLKEKLNDKDAQIERLKKKLDQKDEAIERLREREHNLARVHGTIDMQELLEAEERAIEAYIRELALRSPEIEDPELDAIIREAEEDSDQDSEPGVVDEIASGDAAEVDKQ